MLQIAKMDLYANSSTIYPSFPGVLHTMDFGCTGSQNETLRQRGLLLSVWSPAVIPQAERSKTEPLTFVPRAGRMWEGAGRIECGELVREGNSRMAKAGEHKGSGADEEMRSRPQPLRYPGSVRDLLRAAELALLPRGGLGKMRLGKSRCLSSV